MRTPRSALVLLGLACAPTATSQARVACLGDSITYGARIGDRAHASYPAQLAALRPADDVRNFGVGGATLLARADRPLGATAAFAEALAWRPDVAVVMLGTNDTCQSASRPNWEQRDGLERDARAMVERLRRANPAVRVVLATPPAMFPDRDGLLPPRRADLRARAPRLAVVAKALQRAAAAAGVEYLELRSTLAPRHVVDGVHPDAFGAERIAQRVDGHLRGSFRTALAPIDALRQRLDADRAAVRAAPFEGFDGVAFSLPQDEVSCRLVAPHTVAAGAPWVLRARFFGHQPDLDVALLERGFHLAYCDVQDLYGNDEALARWDAFYALLTELGLSARAVLEGMSRGGLPIVNWAAARPEQVAAIYGDNPVADFRSWPGGRTGKRSAPDWRRCLQAYGLDEAGARAYDRMPLDRLAPIAAAAVPLLLVLGQDDAVVPPRENGEALAQRYRALGGPVTVWRKPGQGHHPHGLSPVDPLLRAVLRATTDARMPTVHPKPSVEYRRGAGWGDDTWREQVARMRALARAHRRARVVLLGDSITQGLTGADHRAAVAGGARAIDRAFGDLGALALGLSGDRTEHLLWRIENGALAELAPAVVVLQIGVNNVNAAGHTAVETAAGVRAVVAALRRAQPQAHVLICGPFPGGARASAVRRTLDEVHERIAALGADERVHYLDLRGLFLDEQGATNRNMRPDRIHLTAAGASAWMQAVAAPARALATRAR